jgi:thiol-disulfide isomerase/thioredoxin
MIKIATTVASATVLFLTSCTGDSEPEQAFPQNYREILAMAEVIEIHGETADSTMLGDDKYVVDNLDYIIANNQRVAVLFSAYWCKDCYKFDPWFKEAAAYPEFDDIVFASAEVDGTRGNENLRKRFELPGVPVVILFENGQILQREGTGVSLYGEAGDKTLTDILNLLNRF